MSLALFNGTKITSKVYHQKNKSLPKSNDNHLCLVDQDKVKRGLKAKFKKYLTQCSSIKSNITKHSSAPN